MSEPCERAAVPSFLLKKKRTWKNWGIESLKPPRSFWKNLNRLPPIHGHLPRDATRALLGTFPRDRLSYKVVRREAGLGSLGQIRFVAIAEYRGGYLAREAKNVRPSANLWLNGRTSRRQSYYEDIMTSAQRSPDPYLKIAGS